MSLRPRFKLALLPALLHPLERPLFGRAATVTPAIRASITSGVAPLGVLVDGVGTTGPGNPFHDYTYFFDFGDTDSNVFSYGARVGATKNKAVGGPLSLYVYETPGTYTLKMWVYDGSSVYGPVQQTITVTDPNAVYAGTATVCVSTSGTFTGAPSGAVQVTSSDLASVLSTYALSNKRVLFRAGEVFSAASQSYLSGGRTGCYFGAFGSGAKPILRSAANNVGLIIGFPNGGNMANSARLFRVVGLRMESGGFTGCNGFSSGVQAPAGSTALYPEQAFGDHVVHDCEFDGINQAISIGGRNCVGSKLVTTNICNGVATSGGVSVWAADVYQFGLIDCDLHNGTGGEHVARLQGGKYFASRGLKLRSPASGKHYFAQRGDTRYETQYAVHEGLFTDGSTTATGIPIVLQIAPQNTSTNEPISDVIVENSMLDTSASISAVIGVEADDIQIRNTGIRCNAASAISAINLRKLNAAGLPAPAGLRLRNISHYHTTSAGSTTVSLAAGTSGATLFGVVSYAPLATKTGANNGTAPAFIADGATGTVMAGCSSDSQVKSTDPLWSSPAAALSGYQLGIGSPYIDACTPSKALVDALGKLRNVAGASDAGAVNCAAQSTAAWSLIP